MSATVSVVQHGRAGEVIYREGRHDITGYQEFGGGDVVAIVSMGDIATWHARHGWALARRAEILRFIAAELIRQKAPTCSAHVDEASGDIMLRVAAPGIAGDVPVVAATSAACTAAGAATANLAWVGEHATLKGRFGVVLLVAALLFAAAGWFKTHVLVVQSVPGTPLGPTVHADTHLATLIDTRQPYTPSLHHDPSTERHTLSVFLVPLDGAPPALVQLARDLAPGSYSLARVIGSDGHTLWVDGQGLLGVDLHSHAVIGEAELARQNPALDARWMARVRGMDIVDGRLRLLADDHASAYALDPVTRRATAVKPRAVAGAPATPPLGDTFAAGLVIAPDGWFGLLSNAELAGAYRPGEWLRAVESATDTPRAARRLVRGELGDETRAGDLPLRRVRAMQPVDDTVYRNAALLRPARDAEPLRLAAPDSVLMLHASGTGGGATETLWVARVDVAGGHLLWHQDTGLDRFTLGQILPAPNATVFVGTRPPVRNKVSEPMLVILDHATGRLVTHSLWR